MEISFNPCLINGDRKKQTNKKIKKELLYGSARLDCHWEAGVGRRIVFLQVSLYQRGRCLAVKPRVAN